MVDFLSGIRKGTPSVLLDEYKDGKSSNRFVDGAGKSAVANSQVSPSPATPPATTPFAVIVDSSSSDTAPKVKVFFNSYLWRNFSQIVTIGGLNTALTPQRGWPIFLQIDLTAPSSTPAISSASIKCGQQAVLDAEWVARPNPIILAQSGNSVYHRRYCEIIADVVDPKDERPGLVVGAGVDAVKIIQHLRTNLLATIWALDGLGCLVPVQHNLALPPPPPPPTN